MSIKSDKWIERMAKDREMIKPFSSQLISKGKISYGLSCYGYDIRLDNKFKVFTLLNNFTKGEISATQNLTGFTPLEKPATVIDPKKIDNNLFRDIISDVCIIPAHSFVLAQSVEYFKIPRNAIGLCFGKSTYTRCGVIVNVTPLEAEWEGYLTVEISNISSLPAKLYAGEGIAQILFLEADEVCRVSYADRKGKYQKQKEVTVAKI